jgi:predicted metalloprotease with PDZ domain
MRFILLAVFISFIYKSSAQEYKVLIDLTQVENDRVPVEITFDRVNFENIEEYQMPKMVPGTYSISDFGRVIINFHAFDNEGNELLVNRLDSNRWEINNAMQLSKINYWVDDTFDEKRFKGIFEPGGTNIEEDNFLINHFGFVGYLKGRTTYPYSIWIIHPERLYGVSPLERTVISPSEEVFNADNYFQLTDSPIMYSEPDTASIMIGETKVMVSVYSPSGQSNAEFMMSKIEPTLIAAGKYLGGELPVKRYVILIYMHSKPTLSGAMGALEHSYSTVFSYPDVNPKYLAQTIVDVTSHEFFHIITPLTIHSEEIGNYDFSDAKMSKHLWLYEGVTEYSSMRVQIMYDLIDSDEYFEVILSKIHGASAFIDTLPFTEMSMGALDIYENQYSNVYEKGALIGMCLDLLLLHESNGGYDIRQLLNDLALKYGIDKSFKDEELFGIITDLTYPSVGEFLDSYVAGKKTLPIVEYLDYAGAEFIEQKTIKVNSLGNVAFGFDSEKESLVISDVNGMDEFGRDMDFQKGDLIYKIMDKEVTLENYQEIFNLFFSMSSGDKVYFDVYRENKKGKDKLKRLKAKIIQIDNEEGEKIDWKLNATSKQLKVREAWIGKKM